MAATTIYVSFAPATRIVFGGRVVVWKRGLTDDIGKPLRRRRRARLKLQEIGMTTYLSAAELVRLVGDFAQRQPDWAEAIIYETKPDERWDLTLVSRRVYGNPDEVLAVMAAAGLDSMEQELTERTLKLPTARQLAIMKQRGGFNLDPWSRTAEQKADPVYTR